jgi:hypothetical protein
MKNEDTPGTPEQPWNTNEVVFGGITCKQLSHLCTGFISALRMANGEASEYGIKGQMNLVATLINQQLALAESPDITEKERKIVEANLATSLQAVCLAGLFSVNQIDIRHMVGIGISTISMIHKLSETTGPIGADEEVIIQIRKSEELGDDNVEMGIRLEPSIDMEEKMNSTKVGKTVKKITEGPSLNPPEIGPFEQGPN